MSDGQLVDHQIERRVAGFDDADLEDEVCSAAQFRDRELVAAEN